MKEDGFTLIEMLIVLMIISVLLLITVPNVAKQNKIINDKGCEAYVKMAQAQVQAYEIETEQVPTLQQLLDGGYIQSTDCPNGAILQIENGVVSQSETSTP